MQPQQQPPPPAGWYPHGPGMQRYWDGRAWTGPVAPLPQQPVVHAPQAHPRAVSGMSTGEHIPHLILTVCTLGLWAPLWWLRSRLSRRRIIY